MLLIEHAVLDATIYVNKMPIAFCVTQKRRGCSLLIWSNLKINIRLELKKLTEKKRVKKCRKKRSNLLSNYKNLLKYGLSSPRF